MGDGYCITDKNVISLFEFLQFFKEKVRYVFILIIKRFLAEMRKDEESFSLFDSARPKCWTLLQSSELTAKPATSVYLTFAFPNAEFRMVWNEPVSFQIIS